MLYTFQKLLSLNFVLQKPMIYIAHNLQLLDRYSETKSHQLVLIYHARKRSLRPMHIFQAHYKKALNKDYRHNLLTELEPGSDHLFSSPGLSSLRLYFLQLQ